VPEGRNSSLPAMSSNLQDRYPLQFSSRVNLKPVAGALQKHKHTAIVGALIIKLSEVQENKDSKCVLQNHNIFSYIVEVTGNLLRTVQSHFMRGIHS
jgi:hypothetical protein